MPGPLVVLRYHEIALKGRNRPFFVRGLIEHVERVTADLPVGRVSRASARLLLPLRDPGCWPEARVRLARQLLARYGADATVTDAAATEAALHAQLLRLTGRPPERRP